MNIHVTIAGRACAARVDPSLLTTGTGSALFFLALKFLQHPSTWRGLCSVTSQPPRHCSGGAHPDQRRHPGRHLPFVCPAPCLACSGHLPTPPRPPALVGCHLGKVVCRHGLAHAAPDTHRDPALRIGAPHRSRRLQDGLQG